MKKETKVIIALGVVALIYTAFLINEFVSSIKDSLLITIDLQKQQ